MSVRSFRRLAGAGLLALVLAPGALQAQQACAVPALPARPDVAPLVKPTDPPPAPECAARRSCSDAQMIAYNTAIDAFNARMSAYNEAYNRNVESANAYLKALIAHADTADAFVGCERDRLNEILRQGG